MKAQNKAAWKMIVDNFSHFAMNQKVKVCFNKLNEKMLALKYKFS